MRTYIVQHVKEMMEERERNGQMSNIQLYAESVQKPYLTKTMKEVVASGTYTGPPKYLKQRVAPLEIPMECIRRLADAIDSSFDERLQIEELFKYVEKHQIPFEEGVVEAMYNDATSGRGYVCEA